MKVRSPQKKVQLRVWYQGIKVQEELNLILIQSNKTLKKTWSAQALITRYIKYPTLTVSKRI